MATGTPVISTPIGGIPDVVVNGQNGFLVPVNSPQDIADKIELILNDRKLWEKLSQNALRTIKNNFDLKITEKKLINLYTNL